MRPPYSGWRQALGVPRRETMVPGVPEEEAAGWSLESPYYAESLQTVSISPYSCLFRASHKRADLRGVSFLVLMRLLQQGRRLQRSDEGVPQPGADGG